MVKNTVSESKTSEADKKTLEVDGNKVFTHDDLKDWNSEGHIRLVMKGEVYDLSNFDHPGGF